MKNKFTFLLLSIISIISFGFPKDASAQFSIETPFGGMYLFSFDEEICDCSGSNVHFILDYKSNSLIKLYKGPSSKFYDNNNASATYQLGTYMPMGTTCTMIAYPECMDVTDVDGTYGSMPGTGTSSTFINNFATSFIKSAKNLFRTNYSS